MNNPRKKNDSPESKKQEKAKTGVDIEMADAGNMDKIRDILFGNQARDYEKRFAAMETRVARETSDLKQELLKRIDALEGYIKQEIKDINERIKNESGERSDADESIHHDMKDGFERLSKKLLIEEENLAKKSTELREQILEQSKTLSDDILSKHEQASGQLRQAAKELDETKVNRSDLSGFFLEIAMRLSSDDNGGISGISSE